MGGTIILRDVYNENKEADESMGGEYLIFVTSKAEQRAEPHLTIVVNWKLSIFNLTRVVYVMQFMQEWYNL